MHPVIVRDGLSFLLMWFVCIYRKEDVVCLFVLLSYIIVYYIVIKMIQQRWLLYPCFVVFTYLYFCSFCLFWQSYHITFQLYMYFQTRVWYIHFIDTCHSHACVFIYWSYIVFWFFEIQRYIYIYQIFHAKYKHVHGTKAHVRILCHICEVAHASFQTNVIHMRGNYHACHSCETHVTHS